MSAADFQMENLKENGFFIIKGLVPSELITQSLDSISETIRKFSEGLGISTSEYMNCTGRWGPSSQLTRNVSQRLNTIVKNHLESSLLCELQQKKSNVICKTADIIDAVPFHQDISYSYADPYHFSAWVALNNVSESSGALRVIENSHKWGIQPLVDFWSPRFVDRYANNRVSYKIKSQPVSAGDAIVFDSRLFHGSDENTDAKDRFAYVTRWVVTDQSFPNVPQPQPSAFGILNSGKLTESILRKYLSLHPEQKNASASSMQDLIKLWLVFVENVPEVNVAEAKENLHKLLVLNQAKALHDAGDVSGRMHKNVWLSLLIFLNKKVNVVELDP